MDTRAWGPSGWQLLHLIAHENPKKPERFFETLKDILPCKFCRESTAQFLSEIPIEKNVQYWLYKFHNRVNKKLRDQCREDPRVICPPPDPSFEQVKEHYDKLIKSEPSAPPGMDFLFCIAYNYTPEKEGIYRHFFEVLSEVYPYSELQIIVKNHVFLFSSKRALMKSVYDLMKKLTKTTHSEHILPTFLGVFQRYGYYASSCNRGKTCRNGKKKRDHRKTYRVTHARLLHVLRNH
jgi:Erv1 / Alr family